jgi:putative ABC transport system permease protein
MRAGLLLRGMRWRLGTSLLTVLTTTIAVATAVLGPMYLLTAGDSVVRRTVADAAVQDRGLTVLPTTDRVHPLGPVLRAERTYQTAAGERRWFGAPITTVQSGVILPSGNKSQLFSRTGICSVLHFIRGSCDLGLGDVVMTERGARQAGAAVGRTIDVQVTGGTAPMRLRVTGIVATPDLGLPYWWGDGVSDFPFGLSRGGAGVAASTDPLISSAATALSVPVQDVPTAMGQLPLRPDAVSLSDEPVIKRVLSRTAAQLTIQGIQTGTQLTALLASADSQRHAMATIVAVGAIQLVLLAVWVLGSLLVRSSEARRAEARIARLRGFPGGSTLWATAAEPALLCLVGVVFGVTVAWGTLMLARAKLFVPQAVIAFDGWTFAALGLTVAAVVGTLGIGTVRLLRLEDPDGPATQAPGEASVTSRVADAVLIVLAAVALVALATTGALNGHSDPIASAAPGLLALGVAVLGVQLILFACRFGISLTADSRWVGSFLALRQSVRRPRLLRQARVLVIALCLACFAAATWSVARSNRATAAEFTVGARRVITVAPQSPTSLQAAVQQIDPRGRFAMAAIGVHTQSTTLLAVDPARLSATTSWPRGISAHSLRSVTRLLAPSTVSAVQLPEAPFRVTARTAYTKPHTSVHLGAWVFDAAGGTAVLDLGALHSGEGVYRGELSLLCPGGCQLDGLGLLPAVGRSLPAGSVRVGISHVSTRLSDGSWRDVIADLVPGGWRAEATGVQVGPSRGAGFTLTATPAAIAADGDATGAITSPMVAPADHPQTLPGVATTELESLNAGTAGPVVTQGLDGNTINVRPAASATALPRVGGDAVMVNLGFLAAAQVGPTIPGATDEVWLGPRAPHDVMARLRAAGLRPTGELSSASVFSQLERSGPAFADDFLLVATIAALLVAAASTLGTLGTTTRERAAELTSLEVAGVPRPVLARSLGLESAILILTALCGAGAGVVAALLAVPSLPELTSATFAPLQYGLPAGLLALVTLVVVLAVALVAASVSMVLVRRMSPALLRTVTDDG